MRIGKQNNGATPNDLGSNVTPSVQTPPANIQPTPDPPEASLHEQSAKKYTALKRFCDGKDGMRIYKVGDAYSPSKDEAQMKFMLDKGFIGEIRA